MINIQENKNLMVGNKLTILFNNSLLDVEILEKIFLDKGDIDFLIKDTNTKDNVFRIKHRNLKNYKKYKN